MRASVCVCEKKGYREEKKEVSRRKIGGVEKEIGDAENRNCTLGPLYMELIRWYTILTL